MAAPRPSVLSKNPDTEVHVLINDFYSNTVPMAQMPSIPCSSDVKNSPKVNTLEEL